MIKLVPIDAVQASEYNPRRNDEKRLALTELSLRKLGFLLPIYADESGEILSESMDDLMVELYYEMKRENGYTEEQIAAKRRSLENVLSPLKAEWNADLLRTAGFRKVDMFWRCLNFCGWIAVK